MRLRSLFFLSFLFSIISSSLFSQFRDPNFGFNGFVKQNILVYDKAYDVIIQDDNKVLTIGEAAEHPIYGDDIIGIVRYKYDGALDSAFGDTGIVYLSVNGYSQTFYYDMALQSDQKMIIGGQYSTNRFILRLNQDGSLDSSFATNGIYDFLDEDDFYWNIFSFKILEDDKILAFRRTKEFSVGPSEYELHRFTEDGVLDSAYGIDGKIDLNFGVEGDYILGDFLILEDSKLLLNGSLTTQDEFDVDVTRHVIIKMTEDGVIDSTFGIHGLAYDHSLNLSDFEVQTDGKIVCAGTVNLNPQGTAGAISLSRFTMDGFIDSSFSDEGHATVDIGVYADYANALCIQNDGKIVIGGSFFNFSGGSVTDCVVARFNQNGTLDNSFGINGVFKTGLSSGTDIITEMALQDNNKIVFVGYANYSSFDYVTVRIILDDITASPDTSICIGSSANLHAYSDSLIIGWAIDTLPEVLISTNTSITVNPTEDVNYLVYGISDTAYVSVFMISSPSISLMSDSILCDGETLMIDASYPNSTYLWQDSSSNSYFNAIESGTYYVEVNNVCGSISDSVDVLFNPLPIIDLGEDLFMCEGNEYTLNAELNSAIYLWQDSSSNATFTVIEGGNFWVELMMNNCFYRDSIHAFYSLNSASYIEINACDSLVSPSTNYIYYESGIYSDTIPNNAFCDSIISLDLSIYSSSFTLLTIEACENYIDPNGDLLSISGSYEYILQSESACDSIVLIDLVINTLDASVNQVGIILSANAENVNYQWLDCENAFSPIEGETEQQFIPQNNGTFAVEISDENCSMISDCFNINSLAISESQINTEISIYPNPTNEYLHIDLNNKRGDYLKLINSFGEEIFGKKIFREHIDLDLSNYSKGIYIIQILNETNSIIHSEKIVIQ